MFVVLSQLLRRFPQLEQQLPADWLAAQRTANTLGDWMVYIGEGGVGTVVTLQQVGLPEGWVRVAEWRTGVRQVELLARVG